MSNGTQRMTLAQLAAQGGLATLCSRATGTPLRDIAEAAAAAQGKARSEAKPVDAAPTKGETADGLGSGKNVLRVFTVTLPVPPSLNNAYKNVRRGRVLTAEAKDYKENAKNTIQARLNLTGFFFSDDDRFALTLKLYFSSNHRRDISNCAKLPEDALSEVLGFDDCRVDRMVVERAGISVKFPRCEILLEVIS